MLLQVTVYSMGYICHFSKYHFSHTVACLLLICAVGRMYTWSGVVFQQTLASLISVATLPNYSSLLTPALCACHFTVACWHLLCVTADWLDSDPLLPAVHRHQHHHVLCHPALCCAGPGCQSFPAQHCHCWRCQCRLHHHCHRFGGQVSLHVYYSTV